MAEAGVRTSRKTKGSGVYSDPRDWNRFPAPLICSEFSLFDPCCTQGRPSPPRRAPQTEFKEAHHNLCEATYLFLVRAFREKMIDEATLRQACDELGISVDKSDLKARI